jgi:type II secretory pathway predicted ATPase ExeA
MDEEDKKLIQFSEELQIDPEEIFGNFLHVISAKRQLVKSLEYILDDHTKTVYLMITGTRGSGKTTLAKDITLFLNKAGKLKSSKIAKIKADKLNTIDVMSKKETLRDCCVVVENASELKRKTIDSLLELSQSLQGNIAFVFEENKKNMNKLFRECPKLMDLFKNRIHLPQYTGDDLMGFAYACLKQKDYGLNTKAEELLQQKVYLIAKQSEPHQYLELINDLMQSAMNATDLRMGKQLSELAIQGRLKDVENLSILPEDFAIKL